MLDLILSPLKFILWILTTVLKIPEKTAKLLIRLIKQALKGDDKQ